MYLIAAAITRGQAVWIVSLCTLLFLFISVDIYLVLSLRRKNKKLAKKSEFNPTTKAKAAESEATTDKN